ncbi:hypothetical protein HRbin06_00713 [archaeon HR06]|nr:hypothetical protein HRbin06_00713 [archaeon HR06]
MGRVDKGVKCSLEGCKEDAVRSLSYEKVSLFFKLGKKDKRVYLCKNHYKEWKKLSKKDRELERLKF